MPFLGNLLIVVGAVMAGLGVIGVLSDNSYEDVDPIPALGCGVVVVGLALGVIGFLIK